MPETPDQITKDIAKRVVETRDINALPNGELRKGFRDRLRQIVFEENMKLIATGTEAVIVGSPERNDIVTAIDYFKIKDVTTTKRIFYNQRIMSTLFPHNFPKFYTSFGRPESTDYASGTVRQRIEKKKWFQRISMQNPFSLVKQTVKDLDMPIYFDVSGDPKREPNIMHAIDGEYYMDTIKMDFDYNPVDKHSTFKKWNIEKVRKYMEENNFSDVDKEIVSKSMARVNELNSTS